jgi:hypothetical protein
MIGTEMRVPLFTGVVLFSPSIVCVRKWPKHVHVETVPKVNQVLRADVPAATLTSILEGDAHFRQRSEHTLKQAANIPGKGS